MQRSRRFYNQRMLCCCQDGNRKHTKATKNEVNLYFISVFKQNQNFIVAFLTESYVFYWAVSRIFQDLLCVKNDKVQY